jgi:hypothetical protein
MVGLATRQLGPILVCDPTVTFVMWRLNSFDVVNLLASRHLHVDQLSEGRVVDRAGVLRVQVEDHAFKVRLRKLINKRMRSNFEFKPIDRSTSVDIKTICCETAN